MWLMGLGRVKTKSDLVVMPSGRQILRSLDHLVGDSEQRRRYDKIQHARGLHIDPQFELARLHDWQIRGLRAFEDATDINANLTIPIDYVGSIAHQTPGFGVVTQRIRRREVMECR
jgi:hypothetical protein